MRFVAGAVDVDADLLVRVVVAGAFFATVLFAAVLFAAALFVGARLVGAFFAVVLAVVLAVVFAGERVVVVFAVVLSVSAMLLSIRASRPRHNCGVEIGQLSLSGPPGKIRRTATTGAEASAKVHAT